MGNRAHLVTRLEFQDVDTVSDDELERIENVFCNLEFSGGQLSYFEGHVDEIEERLPEAGFDERTTEQIRKDIATMRAKGEEWLRYHCF